MSEPVLVIGATGQQGGAVARHLRANGLAVRAMLRDPARGGALAALGCEICTGDLDDSDSVLAAMDGCRVAFAAMPFGDTGAEIRRGTGLVDVAAAVGAHLVYSSAGTAGLPTGVPQFDSKLSIEGHILTLGIPHTLLGPTFYMESFASPGWIPGLKYGVLAMALPEGIPLQLLALDDLGEFAAIVCESPEAFAGQRIALAGDELDGHGMAAALASGIGIDVSFAEVPLESIEAANPEFAQLFAWYGTDGFSADIPVLRREYPIGWHTLEAWAAARDWSILLD
jgi:uncharacterized protein YbjT (DUF2867 family)